MDNKEKIIQMVNNKSKTLKEIAGILKITEKQLNFLLISWGLVLPKKTRIKVQMPDRDTLLRLYEQNKSTGEVAKVMGVSIGTVIRWMRSSKIPMRRMAKMNDEEKKDILEYHINTLKI